MAPSWYSAPHGSVLARSLLVALITLTLAACRNEPRRAPELDEGQAIAVALPVARPAEEIRSGDADASVPLESEEVDAPALRNVEASLKSRDPTVLSRALQALALHASKRNDERTFATELEPLLLELAEHSNPAVRGRALRLLGSLGHQEGPPWPPPGTGWGPRNGVGVIPSSSRPAYVPVTFRGASLARAWAALEDPYPHVRAEACQALAHMGYVTAIHRLIRLVDDGQRSEYEFSPGGLRHEVEGLSFVGESAIQAIRILSAPAPHPPQLDSAQSWEVQARLLHAWYKRHARDRVPATGPGPVLPATTRYLRAVGSGVHGRVASRRPTPQACVGVSEAGRGGGRLRLLGQAGGVAVQLRSRKGC